MAVTESSNPTPAVVNNPIARVMSPKLYLVLSAYSFSTSSAPVTSSKDLSVFTMIVRVDFNCSLYSWRPSIIGPMVNVFNNLAPADIATFVNLNNAADATSPIKENRLEMTSAALDTAERSTPLPATVRPFNVFADSTAFCLNASFSSVILTIFSSTGLI